MVCGQGRVSPTSSPSIGLTQLGFLEIARRSTLSRMRTPRTLLTLLLTGCVVVLSACQVRTATGIEVNADGSGRVEVLVALDEELTTDLAEAEIEPFEDLADDVAGWSVSRETIDGGMAVRVASAFASPADLTTVVDQLNAGLVEGDPRVLDEVALSVAADGAATFSARAGLAPPTSTGVQAQGLAPDGDDLLALLSQPGQNLVRVEVRLTLPGDVLTAMAEDGVDEPAIEGRTVVWELSPTGLVQIGATGAARTDRTVFYAIGAGLVGLMLGIAAVVVRRRDG